MALWLNLCVNEEQADRLVREFPEFAHSVENARTEKMRQACGIRSGSGSTYMPLEIFMVNEIAMMWHWNFAQRVSGIEYIMSEPVMVAVGQSW